MSRPTARARNRVVGRKNRSPRPRGGERQWTWTSWKMKEDKRKCQTQVMWLQRMGKRKNMRSKLFSRPNEVLSLGYPCVVFYCNRPSRTDCFLQGRTGYFVKWKGYGPEENSWVDENDAG